MADQTFDSPQLNSLLNGGSSPAPTPESPKFDSPKLNELLGGSTIPPVKPIDTSAMFPKSAKLVDPKSGDNSVLGIAKNTVTGIPKAFWNFLGPGKIQDYLNTPEGQQDATNLSPSDFTKNIVPAAAQFVAQPLSDITGQDINLTSNLSKVTGDIHIQSIQHATKTAVENGENPFVAVIKAVPQAIFDGLMVAGLAQKTFAPRENVVSTGYKQKMGEVVNSETGLREQAPIPIKTKNFRLASVLGPESTQSRVPNNAIDALAKEQGIKINYDPNQPSFFRQTTGLNGNIKGEIIQLKPSFFSDFINKFRGNINSVPDTGLTVIHSEERTLPQIKENLGGGKAPAEIHPTLLAETQNNLVTHGEDVTHQGLQDHLGATPAQASSVIQATRAKQSAEAIKNPERAVGKIAPQQEQPMKGKESDLTTEARKYKSAEEFVKAKKGDTIDVQRYNGVLSNLEPATTDFEGKPLPEKLTIYRAGKSSEILPGDFVASSEQQAKQFISDGKTITKMEVSRDDLKSTPTTDRGFGGTEGQLIYAPKGVDSLTDFYNKAVGEKQSSDISKIKDKILDFKPQNEADRTLLARASSEVNTHATIGTFSKMGEQRINKFLARYDEVNPKQQSPEQPEIIKAIDSTPESQEIAKSSKVTGFEYNPESGFINVEPLAKAVSNVQDFIKETKKGTTASGNLDDSLYTMTKENEADRIFATDLAKKVDISPEDAEAIYHYEEDHSLELTSKQKEIYETSIKPLADASAKIAHKLKDIIPGVTSEEYTPRFVAGRGNIIDRIKSKAQGIGGKGTVLGKAAPSLKHRTMRSLTDADGNRFVASIKEGRVTMLQNKKPTDLGALRSKANTDNKNKNEFISRAGKKYTIGEATTKEIETHTKLTYHKNVFVNRLVTYLNLRQVERATDFLEAYKESPEFKSIGLKFGEGMAPEDWKTTVNPSFRGYMLEPHVADVMDKYASSMMKGEDPLAPLTAMNSFLRTAIFFNPLIHIPNIGVHWLVNRGASPFINPLAYARLAKTSARAINAVVHQNADYVEMLRSGAPLLYSSQNTRNMHNLLMTKMMNEIDKNPALDFLKKGMRALNPYVLSGKATWMMNDVATMQAIYEEMATDKSLTMEQAIKNVGAHIPNYRLPANKVVNFLTNPNVTMFGAYHYGALKSYYEMAKTLTTGNTEGRENKTTGEKTKARGGVLDKLLMLGALSLVIYPAIDRALQKATKNPNAKIRRAGAVTFPYNISQVASGQEDFGQFLQSVITPAVGTKESISQLFNIDLFTGQHIRDTSATGSEQFKEAVAHGAKAVAPIAQYQKVDTGAQTTKQFIESLGGISDPDKAKTSLSNTVQSAQAKVDKLDKTTVTRVQKIYDQVKKLGFGTPEADALTENLSSSDFSVYKDIKAIDTAKQNLASSDKIEAIVKQAHDLGFGTPEADKLTEDLSPDEFDTYKTIKKALYGVDGKSGPETPTYADGSVHEEKGFIGSIVTYGKAFGIDPVTAFERIFTGQTIRRLDNGQIIVDRNDKKEADTKKQLGGTKDMILDHLKSFELGGDNSTNNMWLIPKDQAAEDDKVENYLGNALRKGLITGKQAQEYEVRYKKSADAKFIDDRVKKTFDSVGDPLTLDEIKNLINQQ